MLALTGILRVHMRRIETEVDEEWYRHTEFEPLHDIGSLLAV